MISGLSLVATVTLSPRVSGSTLGAGAVEAIAIAAGAFTASGAGTVSIFTVSTVMVLAGTGLLLRDVPVPADFAAAPLAAFSNALLPVEFVVRSRLGLWRGIGGSAVATAKVSSNRCLTSLGGTGTVSPKPGIVLGAVFTAAFAAAGALEGEGTGTADFGALELNARTIGAPLEGACVLPGLALGKGGALSADATKMGADPPFAMAGTVFLPRLALRCTVIARKSTHPPTPPPTPLFFARNTAAIGGPDHRAQFQPALPIGPPVDFLHEFVGSAQAVAGQDGLQNFGFSEDPVAQIGREARHIRVPGAIIVALCGIGTPGFGCESDEPFNGCGTGWQRGSASVRRHGRRAKPARAGFKPARQASGAPCSPPGA